MNSASRQISKNFTTTSYDVSIHDSIRLGSNHSLIALCSIDHHAFRISFCFFQSIYENYISYSKTGQIQRLDVPHFRISRSMTSCECLALSLALIRSQGMEGHLFLIFGVTGNGVPVFILFAHRTLIRILSNCEDSAVSILDTKYIKLFKLPLRNLQELLTDVFCPANGIELRLKQNGDCDTSSLQSTYNESNGLRSSY